MGSPEEVLHGDPLPQSIVQPPLPRGQLTRQVDLNLDTVSCTYIILTYHQVQQHTYIAPSIIDVWDYGWKFSYYIHILSVQQHRQSVNQPSAHEQTQTLYRMLFYDEYNPPVKPTTLHQSHS